MNYSKNFGLTSFPSIGKNFGLITNVNVPKYKSPFQPKIYIF